MPFIPYGRQWIDDEDVRSVTEALHSDFITTGPKVQEFETEIAAYCGVRYCVAVSNGTAALHLASLALLDPGDRVLTTPNSFLATSNAILYARAEPIFVDIKPDGNIDLEQCEQMLQVDPGIKALYAVAFSGNMLNQEKLADLKNRYGVIIVEDCAHAIGAVDENGVKAASCTYSDAAILSFHPVKHLTTGEGGAITTNSPALYEKLLQLRNHGIVKTPQMKPWEYEMRDLGFNYRITDIQCALGLSQLTRLDAFIARRHAIAKTYDEAFAGTIVRPLYLYDGRSSYHLYVVRVDFASLSIDKSDLFLHLRDRGIGVQLHYIPINKQPYYRDLGYGDEPTPVMDRYYEECFSIPIYPKLSDEEQRHVITSLFEVLGV